MEAHSPKPGTVEHVYSDFRGRRAGLLKALLDDVDEFIHECAPEKENLHLYGLADGTWEVTIPVQEIPADLPEPVLGINFARDGMPRENWINMVAVHSDSWLISVAFYFGARFGFGRNERKKLFQMINRLPTIYEVVIANRNQPEDRSANHNSGQSQSSAGTASNISPPPIEEDEEEDEEQGAVCGVCEESGGEEFWICCDYCQIWFHGRCVKITPAEAKTIKDYKCPICRKNKKIKA